MISHPNFTSTKQVSRLQRLYQQLRHFKQRYTIRTTLHFRHQKLSTYNQFRSRLATADSNTIQKSHRINFIRGHTILHSFRNRNERANRRNRSFGTERPTNHNFNRKAVNPDPCSLPKHLVRKSLLCQKTSVRRLKCRSILWEHFSMTTKLCGLNLVSSSGVMRLRGISKVRQLSHHTF